MEVGRGVRVMSALMAAMLMMVIVVSGESGSLSRIRVLAAKNNVTCLLVFGDSSVDPGNNNILQTTFKGNFKPYGANFFGAQPTGRFTDGRLATDFIADALGYTKTIPAFLDPKTNKSDLIHGVSFASAASGYDDLTANFSGVLPVRKQLEYLMHYKIHLSQLLGKEKAEGIIKKAIFVVSMGTNDFIQNYYLEPTRSKQYTIEAYQYYLISCMSRDIKMMHRLGATRVAVVGVPPLGCMPLVKTLMGMNNNSCYPEYNKVCSSFNSKIQQTLHSLTSSIGIKTAYVDAFGIIKSAIDNPKKYGLVETSKGCCGTGTIEYGDTCRGLSTCKDPSKYVFWDAVHPSQTMYKILADQAVQSVATNLLS